MSAEEFARYLREPGPFRTLAAGVIERRLRLDLNVCADRRAAIARRALDDLAAKVLDVPEETQRPVPAAPAFWSSRPPGDEVSTQPPRSP